MDGCHRKWIQNGLYPHDCWHISSVSGLWLGQFGAFAPRLDLQKVKRKTMESEWSLGHSWLRMSRFSGSAWLHNSGRRFSSPWGTGFLKRASWNLGWHLGSPPCRGRLWGASAIQEPSSSQWRYNMCQLQPTLTLIWKWHEMTQKKNCSLWISPRWPSLSPKRTSRRNAGSSGFFGWFRRFCRRLPPCMALLEKFQQGIPRTSKLTRRSRRTLAFPININLGSKLDRIGFHYCLHLLLFYHVWITFHRTGSLLSHVQASPPQQRHHGNCSCQFSFWGQKCTISPVI